MHVLEMLRVIQNSPESMPSIVDLESWHDHEPFILSTRDIHTLVDWAISHKACVRIAPEGRILPLLTLLLSMGTEQGSGYDNNDRFLGRKQGAIETHIIHQACMRARAMAHEPYPRAVIFGLSANPPTLNHLAYIEHLLTMYDMVHVVVNASSPLKIGIDYAPAETRLTMLQRMLMAKNVNTQHCILERLEIDREPPSRMIATLSALILTTDSRFTLALGMDALFDFKHWYQWTQYGALCHLKFYPREGPMFHVEHLAQTLADMLSFNISLTLVYTTQAQKQQYEAAWQMIACDPRIVVTEEIIQTCSGSSTQLRHYYAGTFSDNAAIPPNIDPVVDEVIREQRLYGYVG